MSNINLSIEENIIKEEKKIHQKIEEVVIRWKGGKFINCPVI